MSVWLKEKFVKNYVKLTHDFFFTELTKKHRVRYPINASDYLEFSSIILTTYEKATKLKLIKQKLPPYNFNSNYGDLCLIGG